MPYEMSWYIENRVIESRMYGELTVEEFVENGIRMEAFIAEGADNLFLLIDLRDVTQFPASFGHILQGWSANAASTRITWMITLSHNVVSNFFGVLASKFTGAPMRTFKTLEEADAFIARIAPELVATLPSHEAA